MIDLHLHTSASDGSLTPGETLAEARRRGLNIVAITDHDTVAGVKEALSLPGQGPTVIPGLEMTTRYRGRQVDLLGYFIDIDDHELLERQESYRAAVERRARRVVESLQKAGFPLLWEEVFKLARGGFVHQVKIMHALLQAGYLAQREEILTAMPKWLGRGGPGYVPLEWTFPEPLQAISFIRRLGGIPVLAHPGRSNIDDYIPELVAAGLGGIEVYHSQHDPAKVAHYLALAQRMNLLITGGSDYHGLYNKADFLMGYLGIPDQLAEKLQWAHQTSKGG
ncbi:MAG: PHP domain-containing protein [Firmicutes bacterium]|nr:PHP domain-containing protein [Bacillota bacterium]